VRAVPRARAGVASSVSAPRGSDHGPSTGVACSQCALWQGGDMSGAGTARQGSEEAGAPALAMELGVPMDTLLRLFTADALTEFEQPVWMVVNLQASAACRGHGAAGTVSAAPRPRWYYCPAEATCAHPPPPPACPTHVPRRAKLRAATRLRRWQSSADGAR
jgi:hypothetical protein